MPGHPGSARPLLLMGEEPAGQGIKPALAGLTKQMRRPMGWAVPGSVWGWNSVYA